MPLRSSITLLSLGRHLIFCIHCSSWFTILPHMCLTWNLNSSLSSWRFLWTQRVQGSREGEDEGSYQWPMSRVRVGPNFYPYTSTLLLVRVSQNLVKILAKWGFWNRIKNPVFRLLKFTVSSEKKNYIYSFIERNELYWLLCDLVSTVVKCERKNQM